MSTHFAAISPSKNHPFTLRTRPTPSPRPNDLLIAVKSVALNPADILMRQGFLVTSYPTILGFDVAGIVLSAGENVPKRSISPNDRDDDDAPGIAFELGKTRVAAYAGFFWTSFNPDYGAFQERCLVPWQHAIILPDGDGKTISWKEAACLPVAIQVPLSAWDALGIPRIETSSISNSNSNSTTTTTEQNSNTNPNKNEALLIWGASSSIGTMGIQSGALLRSDKNSPFAAVYATSSSTNHAYIRSLGADRVFDYKHRDVVDEIISAAKKGGLVIRHCFLAVGDLGKCQAVLKAFLVGSAREGNPVAKIGSAPLVPADAEVADGVEVVFLQPSMDEEERLGQFRYWLGTWGTRMLGKGLIRPSPKVRVVGRGVGAIDRGLDLLAEGVSCEKLVVEIGE